MKYIAIFAGNVKEFFAHLHSKGVKFSTQHSYTTDVENDVTYVYIWNQTTLHGYRFNDYEVVGTFNERKDASELLDYYQRLF